MKPHFNLLLAAPLLLLGCTSSPRSQDIVRRSTAAATRTIASDVKGAALGIRDGLRHDPNNDPVDINHASKDALESLPGVTSAEAARIIENRPYGHSADLRRRHILAKDTYDKVSSRLVAH
ncbi:DNA uptake protein ComE-like DNA-binding protein [Granulicella aggregans]|uniref:DNA uptake protein ComE-like DNA-binding protein n=1 Tax=Granulicella aggregans TaxID=474949 RepID=A0A7W7ZEN5_9BACT|nr:helix-hairpin-helix domain-containing protein [Granulicella aggregans]MBB5058545.1 DNA uptake protein ComE-like DNA-binding protein [Granulicella aggregans]